MRVLTDDQYTDAWWAARRGVPTASQFGRICTPAKGDYSSSAALYICELIADQYDADYGVVEDYQSAAMKNGTMLEPEARRYYEFERGVEVSEVGLCIDDQGRFGASPDGLCGDDGCVEIKSPTHKTQVQYLIDGGLPTAYKPQVHGHLLVTGRAWCDFLSYAQGLPHLLVRVEPDEYTERLRSNLERFWGEYQDALARIRSLQPSPAIESPQAEEAILF